MLKYVSDPLVALLDEMGAGKTAQVIWSSCFMYDKGMIDTVVIMCPAQVKDVWIHPQYSQIIEHAFVPGIIHEFTSSSFKFPDSSERLLWVVTSVELLRQPRHVEKLRDLLKNRRVFALVDESSTISNWKAAQTRGAQAVGRIALRRSILNGTPYGNSITNLYSQFEFLDKKILGFKNFYAFRNHHCSMGGYMNKQVVGFHDIESIQAKIAPYALRRLKENCLDIAPKVYPTVKEVRLTTKSWEKYVSMRDDLVAYLESTDDVSIVNVAPVKTLRLAQICCGFLGGIHGPDDDEVYTSEIGTELLDAYLDYFDYRLEQDPKLRLITWCRFRPEINRLNRRVRERFPQVQVQVLQGGLSKTAQNEAKTLFHPDAPDPKGAALLIGQPQAGRFGSNFTKCFLADYLSNDWSALNRSQSEDRIHRPGQRFQAIIQDWVVVGPNRERTVSGMILKSLRTNENMAKWVCSRWVEELMQEENDVPF